MDQRHVTLEIAERHDDRLLLRSPANGTVAPPGFYLLFVLNQAKIPSVARIIHLDPLATSSQRQLAVDRWITVRESDHDVDTGEDIHPGDEMAFEAAGDIWAGVAFTGRNGPSGWNNVDHNPKFPLHTGADAHPYSLLGRLGAGSYFYIGARRDRAATPHADRRRLFLRINDDKPGNGNGQFECHIQVWR